MCLLCMLVVLAVIGIFTSLFLTGSVIVFETQFGGITARVSRKQGPGLSNKINMWCINQAHVSRYVEICFNEKKTTL